MQFCTLERNISEYFIGAMKILRDAVDATNRQIRCQKLIGINNVNLSCWHFIAETPTQDLWKVTGGKLPNISPDQLGRS
jgi:hypothetical protein